MDRVPISKINADFNEHTEPKDEKLLNLLGQAYRNTIKCQRAIIPLQYIQPFSDFQPKLSQKNIDNFIADYQVQNPWLLYVYREANKYIMSDDYQTYYIYRKLELPEAMCIVIDPSPDPNIQFIGEPYKLSPPTFIES